MNQPITQPARKLMGPDPKETAKRLQPGSRRQALLRKAREAEIAASITAWISSPGLKPPE